VDIPRNLAIYNQFKATDNLFFSKLIYDSLPEEIRASACVSCGACKPKCPQQIDIPSEMTKIANEFK
jgi:predicted aldo/keto reductase-like oxidoreductase